MIYKYINVKEPVLEKQEEDWQEWWLAWSGLYWQPCLVYIEGGQILISIWDGPDGLDPEDAATYFTGPIPEPPKPEEKP